MYVPEYTKSMDTKRVLIKLRNVWPHTCNTAVNLGRLIVKIQSVNVKYRMRIILFYE